MKLRNIIEQLDRDFPFSYACEWDNVGLLVGDMDADIKNVFLNLDVTDEAVAEASLVGADLILTHHPLLFKPAKTVTEQDFIGRRIRRLIKNDINYIAMHTNFDIAKMADLNACDLQLIEPEILDVTGEDADGNPVGLGRVGRVMEMRLSAFADIVKNAMCLPAVRVYGDPGRIITRCAVSSGSGRSEIPAAIAQGADVLVTGDLDYHTAIDANAQGLALIDAGHYGTEFVYITYMEDYLRKTFPDLKVHAMKIRQPYCVL